MDQVALFHDSIFDAIGAAVQAAGGVKKVAAEVWPALSQDIASARLRSALNPEHAQKLCPSELLLIAKMARDAGSHDVMNYLAAELDYQIRPIEPEDARAQLQRQFTDGVVRLEQLVKRLQR